MLDNISGKNVERFNTGLNTQRNETGSNFQTLAKETFSYSDRNTLEIINPATAFTHEKISTVKPFGFEVATIPMIDWYQGEHLPGNHLWPDKHVKYLDEKEREEYRLQIKDGKLYDSKGKPFDTKEGVTVHSGKNHAIFTMDPAGNLYASNYHGQGKFQHSSFVAGGPTASAGEIVVDNGVLKTISNRCGHYKPSPRFITQALKILQAKGIDTENVENDLYFREHMGHRFL